MILCLHDDAFGLRRSLLQTSCYNFSHQILRPSRMIHPVASCANISLQLHPPLRMLNDRLDASHVFTYSAGMSVLEKVWLEQNIGRVGLHHLHKARDCVHHIVVVAEYLSAIASPDVFPHILRVNAYAVDEPLRLIVKCNVCAPLIDFKG